MDKNELKSDLLSWIETKTKERFSIANDFLLACFDEAIEQSLNSTFNGIPFYMYYEPEEFKLMVLRSWKGSATTFLELPNSHVNIIFRGIPFPHLEQRKELLLQLSQLILKCEDLQ